MKTLMELQEILGNSLDSLVNSDMEGRTRDFAITNAEHVAKLAKQMINNADVILRTDKLCGRNDRTNKIVGD